MLIIGIAVVVALVAAGFFMSKSSSKEFSTLQEIPIVDYRDNANSLSGNQYRLEGKVISKQRWTADRGQVVAVQVDQSNGDSGALSVVIPPELGEINIERGLQYSMHIEIVSTGIARAVAVKAK